MIMRLSHPSRPAAFNSLFFTRMLLVAMAGGNHVATCVADSPPAPGPIPRYGTGGCATTGSQYDYAADPVAGAATRTYRVVPGETFISVGTALLKISNAGGSGANMQSLAYTPASFPRAVTPYTSTSPGKVLGVQHFSAEIRDVDYIEGFTIVSLADGRMVKVNGTGGGGQNMFAIVETSSGFGSVGSYYVGSHRFVARPRDVHHYAGVTFITFDDGKMLKVSGSGGSGANFLGIVETPFDFSRSGSWPYYIGDAKFFSSVTSVIFTPTRMLMGFADGKMLKVSGVGGGGHNMFGVTETSAGFDPGSGPYYVGDAKFQSGVTTIINAHGGTMICLASGKILSVNDIGGSGDNMFAVFETFSGFVSGGPHYRGHQRLSSPVISALAVGNYLILGQNNGKMLKIVGRGGSGDNIFAIAAETPDGYQSLVGYSYLHGSAHLGAPVTGLASIDNFTFVGLFNGKLLKIAGTGGGGQDMFAVVQRRDRFLPRCGYNYLVGSQGF